MSKLIFFVDDDKMILNLLEYTFSSRDNYTVVSYRRGEDCIDNLHLNPDLIVLDHSFLVDNSAFSNGLEILIKIREKNTHVPVVVLSGEQDENIISDYKKIGVAKFIPKDSFFIDTLIEHIENVFSNV